MRKALSIIKSVVTWLLVILAVLMMIFTIISVNTFDRMDRSLFGYKAFIVLSDSMSKTDFKAGDLVLVKDVDPTTLQVGDIIAYQSTNSANYGEVVTHKIRALTTDASGNPGFITYGTTTNVDDENVVTYSFVLGKYKTKLPGVGNFFYFLKTPQGYILCILLPFLILIIMQVVSSIRLFRQYKREQLAEVEAEHKRKQDELARERAELESQRAESQRMLEELRRLQAELGGQKGESDSPPEDAQ